MAVVGPEIDRGALQSVLDARRVAA
jgi:hypothetical protein